MERKQEQSKQKHFIFVYGTLKSGHRNNYILSGQKLVNDRVETEPVYKMYDNGSYPMIVEVKEGGHKIIGELWEVDDWCLKRLDQLEGVPFLYKRTTMRMADNAAIVIGYEYQQKTTGLKKVGEEWRPKQPVKQYEI